MNLPTTHLWRTHAKAVKVGDILFELGTVIEKEEQINKDHLYRFYKMTLDNGRILHTFDRDLLKVVTYVEEIT